MKIEKIKVKYGKDFYTGYYWIETTGNDQTEIHISYEGIKKSIQTPEKEAIKQKLAAEGVFYNLLNDL